MQEKESLLRSTLKDGIFYTLAEVLVTSFGLITFPIFTRIFMPQDYGRYILIAAFVDLLLFNLSWVREPMLRFFAVYEKRSDQASFYLIVFAVLTTSLLLVSSLVYLAIYFLKNGLLANFYPLFLWGLAIFIFRSLFECGLQFLRIERKAKAYLFFSTASAFLRIVLALSLVFLWKKEVEFLLIGWFLAQVVLLPFLLFKIAPPAKIIKYQKVTLQKVKEFVAYGLPFIFIALSLNGLHTVDRFMLQYFRDSREVGLYSISYMLSNLSFIVPFLLLGFSGYPLIISTWESKGQKATEEFIGKLIKYYIMISLPIVFGISILAKSLLGILTRAEYLPAASLIPVLSASIFIWGLSVFTTKGFVLRKRPVLFMVTAAIAAMINIILNALLIPSLGSWGAAFTTAVSYLLFVVASVYISNGILDFKIRVGISAFFQTLIASISMAVVIFLLAQNLPAGVFNLFLLVGAGMVVYLGLLIIFGALKIKDAIGIFYRS